MQPPDGIILTPKELEDIMEEMQNEPIDEPKERKVDFKCPNRHCNATEYKAHYQNNGIIGPGFRRYITHYECLGCSVHFSDPKKFTVKQIIY